MFKKLFSTALVICVFSLTAFAKDIQKVDIKAEMECNACKNKIEKALKSKDGVKKVNTDIKAKMVKVEYDKDVISEADLVKTINDADANFKAECKSDKSCCETPKKK
jgi:copper chaperone CopZ